MVAVLSDHFLLILRNMVSLFKNNFLNNLDLVENNF